MASASSEITLDSYPLADRFRPSPHVVWTTQTDATVLLDGERGLYYTLNDVAGRAWELLAAGEPIIAILHSLTDEYEVEREVLETDVAALLNGLLRAGLIERRAP